MALSIWLLLFRTFLERLYLGQICLTLKAIPKKNWPSSLSIKPPSTTSMAPRVIIKFAYDLVETGLNSILRASYAERRDELERPGLGSWWQGELHSTSRPSSAALLARAARRDVGDEAQTVSSPAQSATASSGVVARQCSSPPPRSASHRRLRPWRHGSLAIAVSRFQSPCVSDEPLGLGRTRLLSQYGSSKASPLIAGPGSIWQGPAKNARPVPGRSVLSSRAWGGGAHWPSLAATYATRRMTTKRCGA